MGSSPDVHADADAVRTLGTAMVDAHRRSTQTLEEAERRLNQVVGKISTELRHRERVVVEVTSALHACEADPEAHCGHLREKLSHALVSRERARRGRADAERLRAQFVGQARVLSTTVENLHRDGHRYLRKVTEQVTAYTANATTAPRISGTGGGAPNLSAAAADPAGGSPNGGTAPTPAVRTVRGLPAGVVMVAVSAIDTSASTVTGAHDFKKGYHPTDLAWAFDAFEQVVIPTLQAGGSADSFQQRDQRAGLMGTRSYAMTYSNFTDPANCIVLRPQPDGTFAITNGQHRVWLAQNSGRQYLPARIEA
jgi:hypothetical protein